MLERLLRVSGVVTIIGMITGSLVYDPRLLDGLARGVGLAGGFTHTDTFRLPIWLTLVGLVGIAAFIPLGGVAFCGFCLRLGPNRVALARPGGFGQGAPPGER